VFEYGNGNSGLQCGPKTEIDNAYNQRSFHRQLSQLSSLIRFIIRENERCKMRDKMRDIKKFMF